MFSRLFVISLVAAIFVTSAMGIKVDESIILYLTFDEGRGETTKDFSKTDVDGELFENPEWVEGKFGKALEFDGEKNYVEVPVDLSPHVSEGEISIAAWVKVLNVGTDQHNQSRQPIVIKGNSGQWEYGLYIYDSLAAGFSLWQCGGSSYSEPRGGNVPLEEWHFVCGTYKDGDAVNVYVDGELAASSSSFSGSPCDGTRPIRIGSREDGQFLNAVIDEVRIWDRALEKDEVKKVMTESILEVNAVGNLATTWGKIKLTTN